MILPMCLLVLLSSLSYAVDPSSPPARVGFSVALVLSIVTFNLVVSQDLPKVRAGNQRGGMGTARLGHFAGAYPREQING
jgi:hypothetical protein